MTLLKTTYDAERVFVHGVRALDIAEPLPSFELAGDAAPVLACLRTHHLPAAGVRSGGFVTHVVTLRALEENAARGADACPLAALARPPAADELLSGAATLGEVVERLHARDFVLVEVLGAACGIVSRRDLEDPPVRMWLFGLLTLIETTVARSIEGWAGEEVWRALLAPARLEQAERLQAERLRRGLETPLLYCLPFSDKGQIVARAEDLRGALGFASRKRAEADFKALERLRNNLAHMQPIVESDWELILRFAQNVEGLLHRLDAAALLHAADLRAADLRTADLRAADLRAADLRTADG